MLAELRGRSQITIPSEIIKNIGARPGDKFEVIEKDGGIFLCPVVVYPKAELTRIAGLVKEAETEIAAGDSTVYDNIDKMFTDMGISY